MRHHLITRPGRTEGLWFRYERDTTSISRVQIQNGHVHDELVREVTGMLVHPAALAPCWVVAVMDRDLGGPASVQRWDWDTLEKLSEVPVPHARFGLLGMGVADNGSRAFLDRCFDDPEDGTRNSAAVIDLESGELLAMLGPMISTLMSPVFDRTGELLALVHTDQGSCGARLYELVEDPGIIAEFGRAQLPTDFYRAAVAFVTDGIVLWTVRTWDGKAQLGTYHDGNFETLSCLDLPGRLTGDADELEMSLGHADLAMTVVDDCVWCGGVATLYCLDTRTGTLDTFALEVEGAVVQVRRWGEQGLLCLTHLGELTFYRFL